MAQLSIKNIELTRYDEGGFLQKKDLIAVEEPLEIRIGYGKLNDRQQKQVAVTMRTPGADLELAAGFLFTEGIITSKEQIESIKHCEDLGKEEEKDNVVRVELKEGVQVDFQSIERNFYASSSCGICGKASIASIKTNLCYTIPFDNNLVEVSMLQKLSNKVNEYQMVFKHTGGLHASALFDLEGNLVVLREDVGRHNALDKLIGKQFINANLPLNKEVLWLSGRLSFELVQKAAMAGFQLVVAVGAPSSLSIQLANEMGMTIIGFLKNQSFNIYTHPERVNA